MPVFSASGLRFWRGTGAGGKKGTFGLRSKCGLGGWGQPVGGRGGLPQHMVCNCGLMLAEKGGSVMMPFDSKREKSNEEKREESEVLIKQLRNFILLLVEILTF